jgi:serine/threonine protein kinase
MLWAFVSVAEINLRPPTHTRIGPNTCLKDGRIYKCYDYRYRDREVPVNQRRSPDLYKQFLGAEDFLNNQDLRLISYPFVEGKHNAQCVGQFVQVIEQLQDLHEKGFCHGDIRASNIVFGESRSMLIDFDFGGKEKEKKYPEGFNRNIYDGKRHKNAKAGEKLRKEHDWYAMAAVMKQHECEEDDTMWTQARRHVENNEVDVALQLLRQLLEKGQKGLQPTTKLLAAFGQKKTATGSPDRPAKAQKKNCAQTFQFFKRSTKW